MIDDQVILPEPDTIAENQHDQTVTEGHDLDEQEYIADADTAEETPEEAQALPQEPESKAERNWREMRERTQRLERERDDAINLLKRIEQEAMAYQQQQQKPAKQEQSIYDIDDDEIIEGRHLKTLVKNEIETAKKTITQYQRQYEESLVEKQIKETYSDWDQVVNHETVKKLNELYPDVAYSLSLNPDLKKKASSTYTIMKNLGISSTSDNLYDQDRKRAQTNLSKPRSSIAAAPQQGNSPLNKANAFATGATQEDLKRLYEEMIASANSQ